MSRDSNIERLIQRMFPFLEGEEDNMEDDLVECRNKRCKRKDVIIKRPNSRYCSECGAKLRTVGTKMPNTEDIPIDMAPDGNSKNTKRDETINGVTLLPKVDVGSELVLFRRMIGGEEKLLDYVDFSSTFRSMNPDSKSSNDVVWNLYKDYKADYERRNAAKSTGTVTSITTYGGGAPRGAQSKPKGSDEFHCEADLEGCPLQPKKDDRLVNVPYEMFQKWVWLAMVHNTEWIAYLKGEQVEGIWEIRDFYFPKQRANGAHVDAEDGEIQAGTIGSVHSHVDMSAYFSAEDKAHFNHPVEMVVNRKGNLAACVRVPLHCGKFARIETTAMLIGGPAIDEVNEALKSKLTAQIVNTGNQVH